MGVDNEDADRLIEERKPRLYPASTLQKMENAHLQLWNPNSLSHSNPSLSSRSAALPERIATPDGLVEHTEPIQLFPLPWTHGNFPNGHREQLNSWVPSFNIQEGGASLCRKRLQVSCILFNGLKVCMERSYRCMLDMNCKGLFSAAGGRGVQWWGTRQYSAVFDASKYTSCCICLHL
jgi:hypothetical protein